MATIQFKRGTRAQLDAAAGNNELHAGEPYLVTDEDAVAIGTGAGDYKDVGASNLGDLSDVDTSSGSTGDVLTQQSDGSFAMEAPSGGGGGVDWADVYDSSAFLDPPDASGDYSAAIGWGASATGMQSLALGFVSVSGGSSSLAIGSAETSGNFNVSIGSSAATSGDSSIAIGAVSVGSEDYSVAVGGGAKSGEQYATSIGYRATAAESNSAAFGANSGVTGADQVQLGDSATTTYVYGTVQSRSDARDKADIRDTALGLDFVMRLRPRDFRWDYREDYRPQEPERPDPTKLGKAKSFEQARQQYEADYSQWRQASKLDNLQHDGSKKRTRYHHGLIAQEVKQVLDDLGIDFGGYQDHSINGGQDVKSIGYAELIAPLIKAVQELAARVEALENPKGKVLK